MIAFELPIMSKAASSLEHWTFRFKFIFKVAMVTMERTLSKVRVAILLSEMDFGECWTLSWQESSNLKGVEL